MLQVYIRIVKHHVFKLDHLCLHYHYQLQVTKVHFAYVVKDDIISFIERP